MSLIGYVLFLIGGLLILSFILKGVTIGLTFISIGIGIITHHFIPIIAIVLFIVGYWIIKKITY